MSISASRDAIAGHLDPLLATLLVANTPKDRQQALCNLVLDASGAVGVALLIKERKSQRTHAEIFSPIVGEKEAKPAWLEDLCQAYSEVLAETPQALILSATPVPRYAVFVPLGKNDANLMVLSAVIMGGRSIRLQNLFDTLQMGRSLLFLLEKTPANAPAPPAPSQENTDTAQDDPARPLMQVMDILAEVYPRTRFVALFVFNHEPPPDFYTTASLLGRLVAPKLADVYEEEKPPLRRAWQWLMLRSADVFGARRLALKLGALAISILLLLSFSIQGDMTVHAPTYIEGVYSYSHTAPLDSHLAEVNVRPGDAVKKGDILGRLDDAELTMEIESLLYQQDIYLSRYRQALQQGQTAEAEIVQLEAQKIGISLAWARQRHAMMRLVSRVDGFVISEDLYPRLGQPVRRGQDLFEITDTADLRVVVRVNENDIPDINTARKEKTLRGEFTLTAYPDVPIGFDVERIHPFTTVEDGVNGFEMEGRILPSATDVFLRPGMEGQARIVCGQASLFTLATRRIIHRIRTLWWRWT